MDTQTPSPQTTLAIFLGASAWPDSPEFPGSAAFAHAVTDFKGYLFDQNRFGLPHENALDLFDVDDSPHDLDRRMRHFLERRMGEMQQAGNPAKDLLVYFVGHGGFVGRTSEYYLAVRYTTTDDPRLSGLPIESLASTLTDKARYLRRILILDCCYAAAAFTAFQAEGPAKLGINQAVETFKRQAKTVGKGTALLCSSGKTVVSQIAPDGSCTMFSKALIQALLTGNKRRREQQYLSLRDVADLTEEVINTMLEGKAPRPEIHSPDQREGDVADVPFFPNLAAALSIGEVILPSQPLSPTVAVIPIHTPAVLQRQPAEIPAAASMAQQGISRRTVLIGLAGLATVAAVGGSIAWLTRSQGPYLSPAAATSTAEVQSTMVAETSLYNRAVTANGVMWGFNAQHTQTNPYERVITPATVSRLKKKWVYQSRTANISPVVAGGVVYIGSYDLYAINADSGRLMWDYQMSSGISTTPAVIDDSIYMGSADGKVYAIDRTSHHLRWTYQTGGPISCSSPAVVDGVVYIGSYDKKVYAIDTASGRLKWSYQTNNFVISSPAVADGVVYVGSSDHNVYAIDASSGNRKWVYQTGGPIFCSSPAVVDGVVYIGSQDQSLYALEAASGRKKWSYRTVDSYIDSSPAVADGVVYIGSVKDQSLYAIDAVLGTKKWSYQTDGNIEGPPTVAGGVVYIGSRDYSLYALEATTGIKKWAYQTDNIVDQATVVADGMVYISSVDRNLYAFGLPS